MINRLPGDRECVLMTTNDFMLFENGYYDSKLN